MTDIQLLMVAVSVASASSAVLTGVLINNSRVTDIKETLRAEIGSAAAEAKANHAELKSLVEKQHSGLLLKISHSKTLRVRTQA